MDHDLLANLHKLHTTELGEMRIKRNIHLETPDIIVWCVQKIKSADGIVRKGKNWYVTESGCIITINVHSYTVITAHKLQTQAE